MAQKNAQPVATTEHIPASEQRAKGFPPFDASTFASQLVWLALTFVALYLLMSRVALPRVGAIIEDRRQRVAGDLAEAQRFKEQSDAPSRPTRRRWPRRADARRRSPTRPARSRPRRPKRTASRSTPSSTPSSPRPRRPSPAAETAAMAQRAQHRGRRRGGDRRAADRHRAAEQTTSPPPSATCSSAEERPCSKPNSGSPSPSSSFSACWPISACTSSW